ncbi:MAG: hypothetical protein R3B70_07280 [Polyangiaceae bacterium]
MFMIPLFFQGFLAGLLAGPPRVDYEWDFEITPPSKDDTCDGKITVWAWLRVRAKAPIDGRTTLLIDRRLLPQRFELIWELDTDADNEIEYCPKTPWRCDLAGSNNEEVHGNYFNPTPFVLTPNPPDDAGTHLRSRCDFSWTSSLVQLTLAASGAAGNVPVAGTIPINLGATGGVGHVAYGIQVDWKIDLKSTEPPAADLEGTEMSRTVVLARGDRAEALVAVVRANRSTLRQGQGAAMFAAQFENNDTLEKTS